MYDKIWHFQYIETSRTFGYPASRLSLPIGGKYYLQLPQIYNFSTNWVSGSAHKKFKRNLNMDLVLGDHPPLDGQRPYFRAF